MVLEQTLFNLFIFVVIIVISSLPLYFAVVFLGGKTTILKTFLVMILVAIVSAVIKTALPLFGTFLAWLLLIWIFHEFFRLKYFKAFIAWVLWIIFVVVLNFLIGLLGLGALIIL